MQRAAALAGWGVQGTGGGAVSGLLLAGACWLLSLSPTTSPM